MQSRFLLAASLSVLVCCAHKPKAPAGDPTGIAAFSAHSRFVGAQVSPNGTYLAAVKLEEGHRVLAFIDLRTRKLASVFRMLPQSVGRFRWVNDSRVVMEVWDEDGTLAQPVNYGEIAAADATGGGKLIFGFRADKKAQYLAASVLSRLRHDDHKVLIATTDFREDSDRPRLLSKLDVYTGRETPAGYGPVAGASFLTDENGEVRIAAALSANLTPQLFYRDPAASGWTPLSAVASIKKESDPVGFVASRRILEVVEPLEKGFGLFAMNIDTGERKLLSRNDWVPPSGYVVDRETQEVIAVETDPDVPGYEFVQPQHPLARMLSGLLDAYPGSDVRLLNTTDDQKQAVVHVYSDRDPGRYLLVDVDHMSAEEIVSSRPWIKPEAMAEMNAFHIAASDGVWIHGYVTLPKGATTTPPLVVIPHGGPHFVRDSWGYDSEVQLLASQGFAVLQVNYRGSGGYGDRFQEMGYRHWGDRVMQDIVDATRYAVSKGWGDARRVCIYGASFGGYAAMQGAIVAPDLFRCAVGYAGVYDLTLMGKQDDISETRLGRGYVRRVVGEDAETLRRMSPAYNAGKLRAKVLLIHGRQDRRAPLENFERMEKALEREGRPPQVLVEAHEGHGFYDEEARERMYTTLLAFLHANTAAP